MLQFNQKKDLSKKDFIKDFKLFEIEKISHLLCHKTIKLNHQILIILISQGYFTQASQTKLWVCNREEKYSRSFTFQECKNPTNSVHLWRVPSYECISLVPTVCFSSHEKLSQLDNELKFSFIKCKHMKAFL